MIFHAISLPSNLILFLMSLYPGGIPRTGSSFFMHAIMNMNNAKIYLSLCVHAHPKFQPSWFWICLDAAQIMKR